MMNGISNEITPLSVHEIDEVSGGFLQAAAAIVAIAVAITYFGGEYHDATCKEH